MKKLTLITTALIAAGMLYTGGNSANAQSKLSFGLNVGAGLPMGDYAKHDSTQLPISQSTHNAGKGNDTTKYNGFAKTGFSFNVYAQYKIAGPIGIKLMIGGTMNSYDISTYNSTYAEVWAENSGNAAISPPTWTASKSYYIGQYMIGPCLKLPAGSKLRIEAQVLVGLVTGSYPTLSGALSISGNSGGVAYSENYTETYSTVSTSAFGYNANAGIEYMIAPMIGLHLNVGYTGSNFSYSNYTVSSSQSETVGGVTSSSSNPPQTYNIAKTMSMGLLQITIGGSVDL